MKQLYALILFSFLMGSATTCDSKNFVKKDIMRKAPDFVLQDESGKWRTLAEFKDKKIVLYFYPKDDTPGCTKEACSFRDNKALYAQHDIIVLGVSYDSPESHKAFKEKYHLPFTLLSDPKKETAKAYGAYAGIMKWFTPQRVTFLINEKGSIIKTMKDVDVSQHATNVLKAFGISE
jgi:peroxiredoxin Q/BCP